MLRAGFGATLRDPALFDDARSKPQRRPIAQLPPLSGHQDAAGHREAHSAGLGTHN
jgi:hypothetical protein